MSEGREPDHTSFAVFLDFDGTLADIAERPDAVRPDADLPEVLTGLAAKLGGALAIVTGRTVPEIDRFLSPARLDVCGMHGLERRVSGRLSRPDLVPLAPQIDALRRAFADRPGVIVEDKTFGVALHWRMAPDAEADALAAMEKLAAELGPDYRIQDGKAVREIVPAASGKGAAIRALMEAPPYLGRVPLFAGDDRTDEHGFEAVNPLGGISIKLGDGPTVAPYRFPDAASFRDWLRAFAQDRAGVETLPAA